MSLSKTEKSPCQGNKEWYYNPARPKSVSRYYRSLQQKVAKMNPPDPGLSFLTPPLETLTKLIKHQPSFLFPFMRHESPSASIIRTRLILKETKLNFDRARRRDPHCITPLCPSCRIFETDNHVINECPIFTPLRSIFLQELRQSVPSLSPHLSDALIVKLCHGDLNDVANLSRHQIDPILSITSNFLFEIQTVRKL